MKKIISTCIYCGCGCKLEYTLDKGKITKVSGWKGDYMSDGVPCVKGLTINEVYDKNRIESPMIRKGKKLVGVSWEQAAEEIYKNFAKLNPSEIFMNSSGKITNEDNLILYKLGQLVFNTSNIDSCCGRLCHISTVRGVMDCFGEPNLTSVKNLDKTDVMFIIGSNPASNYPVFWNKVLKMKNKIKIISVQPLQTLTSEFGDIYLEISPGTEVALLNGIANYLIKNNQHNKKAENYKNFKKLKKIVDNYDLEEVCKETGVGEKDFLKACQTVAGAKNLGVFHGMGFTQHINSLENIHTFLNLVLLKNGNILTLRGEINVQGVGDVSSASPEKLSKLWGKKVVKPSGNMIKSLILSPCKAAFLTEFNPAQSLPNLDKVHKILDKMFIVYLGTHKNLTCDFANVILPLPMLFESQGTITNGEQKVRFSDKITEYKNPDMLEICKIISKKFGKEDLFKYKDSKDIFSELVNSVPWYSKMNPDEVYGGEDGEPFRSIKHRVFMPTPYKGKDDRRSSTYPFLLTTFREKHNFLTSEVTDQSKTLRKLDKDRGHVYISPEDAKEFGIRDNQKIKIISPVSSITALARIDDKIPPKLLATRFHYQEMLVNKLFPPEFDDVTFTPNYKCLAVKIRKVF
ncbi:MAG: molybdopterin-dependent oxidoreductase [archaeon]